MTELTAAVTTQHRTDLPHGLAGTATSGDAAVQAAETAARAADVDVRTLSSLADLQAVFQLYAEIWRPDANNPPITTELLRALTAAGNYVAGAFDGDEMVGACVGFFGAPGERALHSHIAGVLGTTRGRNVGFALKVHQRAWSMARGVTNVAWTFDPLVRRNAYFNLVKLAASSAQYLTNFYGSMHDAINGSDDSDRLLMHWTLDAAAVAAACTGTSTSADADAERANGAAVALGISALGGPALGTVDAQRLLVAVPGDIEALRGSDPGCARDWRVAMREVLGVLLDDGTRVTGFDRAGWYVLDRTDPTNGDPS